MLQVFCVFAHSNLRMRSLPRNDTALAAHLKLLKINQLELLPPFAVEPAHIWAYSFNIHYNARNLFVCASGSLFWGR